MIQHTRVTIFEYDNFENWVREFQSQWICKCGLLDGNTRCVNIIQRWGEPFCSKCTMLRTDLSSGVEITSCACCCASCDGASFSLSAHDVDRDSSDDSGSVDHQPESTTKCQCQCGGNGCWGDALPGGQLCHMCSMVSGVGIWRTQLRMRLWRL